MFSLCRKLVLGIPALCSGAFALSHIQVDNAAVGQKTLIITVDDSIVPPDLSKLQIDGYQIESAVFVEESDQFPTQFTPNYLDLTVPDSGKIVDFVPTSGTLILDLPFSKSPQIGTIIADTSFGGLLRRVVDVDGQPQAGILGRRWVLKTQDADLPEALQNGDITFQTRLDMNQAISDIQQTEDVVGVLPDGSQAFGQLDFSLKGTQVIFQPKIAGRIKITNGQVEYFNVHLEGDCEVLSNVRGNVNGTGEFEYEEELSAAPSTLIPLGIGGLFIKVQNRPSFRIESTTDSDAFAAKSDFRIGNSIKGELGFSGGQWRPLAENKMTFSNKNVQELWGQGQMKLAIKPRLDILVGGVLGPTFTFEPYARFTSTSSAVGDAGRNFNAPTQDVSVFGTGNKEMSLGSNIFMETRTNFLGPSVLRNFVLFNREQTVFSPPKEGTLAVREADSNRIYLQCETFPKADYYQIQQKIGSGPWENVMDKVMLPKIRLGNLKPSSQYRFRAIGFNAMGMGAAFPPDGVIYNTPAANRPPWIPLARFPDSAAVLPDSSAVLAWKGGDSDPGAKVQYTVFLDTHFPPMQIKVANTSDTSINVNDLKPGLTYFWKVVASDGIDKTEGTVRSFTVKPPAPAVPQAAKTGEAGYPVVFVPQGSFRREDGKVVKVGPFFLAKYEVTQAEFEKVMGKNPSYHVRDSLPVERVTWEEAETFCKETGGRLPTEAEWEFAAKAGSNSTFYWGNENPKDFAWYRDNSDNQSQKIGQKKPNAWGFHDMAGNVFEWVQDWYGEYSPTDLDHPQGPETGVAKVIRGASWYSESSNLSLSARYNNRPGFRNFKVGFRCAQEIDVAEHPELEAPLASKSGETPKPGALKP